MGEVDGLGEAVLDDHLPGVALDELRGSALESVREQDGRLFMAKVQDAQLAEGPVYPVSMIQPSRIRSVR